MTEDYGITVGVKGKDKDGNEFNEVFIITGSISGLQLSQDFQDNIKRISDKYNIENNKLEFFASKN